MSKKLSQKMMGMSRKISQKMMEVPEKNLTGNDGSVKEKSQE
jgi:hypothetical protein